jgi:hypothetical protein
MSQGWASGSAVTLANGRVLAIAGDAAGTSTELYDPASGRWTEGPGLPPSAVNWTLRALAHGGALLVGGAVCDSSELQNKCLPTTSTYRLSSSGSEWFSSGSMHDPRVLPAVVRLADGRVLVAGGFGDDCPNTFLHRYSCKPIASAEIYDPVSGQWSITAPMPQARGGASATLLSDGTVLVVGGYSGHDAIRFDPASGKWTSAGQTASPRSGSLLFALPGDRALTLEGEPYAGFFGSLGTAAAKARRRPPRCNPSSETFAAASNTWMVSLTEPAGNTYCPNGALLAGGQVLLSGVLNTSRAGNALTNPYVLDATRRCWSKTAPPLIQRDYGTVAALPDGRALVFGGFDANDQPLSSAEIYTPVSSSCTRFVRSTRH